MSVKSKSSLFRDFLYLQEVISCRQISSAALKNGIKSSNLSKIIKSMEELTNNKLFIRTTHGLIPTPQAYKISLLIADLEKQFDFTATKICGSVGQRELKLYLPPNMRLGNLESFLSKYADLTVQPCLKLREADVYLSYLPPEDLTNRIVVENKIGENFAQTIWVVSVDNEYAAALAQFIINQLHS